MVTGVETAGLVLGSLPLIIEALKSYQGGVKSLKKTRKSRYGIQLKQLARQVQEQKVLLEDNVKKLLFAACPTFDNLYELDDKDWSELRSSRTQVAVEAYLGKTRYQLFEDLLKEFETCLVELAKDLDHIQGFERKAAISTPLTLSDIQNLGIKHTVQQVSLWTRIQYIFKEDGIVTRINELEALTAKMDKILANSKTLHEHIQESRLIPGPESRAAHSMASLLQQIRTYGDHLFQAFREAWAPGCHPSHDAMLFLDTPLVSTVKTLNKRATSYKFRLMLRENPAGPPASRPWHETDVTVSREASKNPAGISPPPTKSNTTQATPAISITHTKASPANQEQRVVAGLCEDVVLAKNVSKCLDLHLLQGTFFTSKEKHHWPSCERSNGWSTITLEQLLSSPQRVSSKQKVSLALKLSASLLQLKTSQWLTATWSNEAIYFPQTAKGSVTNEFEITEPLILQSFSGTTSSNPGQTPEQKPRLMFLELGILLMEIWNQEPFANFAKAHSAGQDVSESMRQGLANDWYDNTYQTMTIRYGKVVRTCVNFAAEYSEGPQPWDDEDLRVLVCAKIIKPLEEECSVFP